MNALPTGPAVWQYAPVHGTWCAPGTPLRDGAAAGDVVRSVDIHYICHMSNVALPRHSASTLMEVARRRSRRRRNLLALEVLKQFRLIYGSVRQHFRRIEAACGVSGSQLWLLQEIERVPGVGVSVLARRLLIHQTTCSQLIDKLVTRGYVRKERSTQDQRRVGLRLSRTAIRALKKAPGPAEGVLPEALTELSDAALRSLSAQLRRVIAELHLRDEKSAGRPLADL
jgi:MarR family transcriptional regulator, organic hydroperoxide resistance regulator